MLSYWGVDHGDEVSKRSVIDDARGKNNYGGHGKPTGGRRAMSYLGGPLHGAVAGKKASGKLKSAASNITGTFGGNIAGSQAGGVLGSAAGAAARNPGLGRAVGGGLGGTVGAVGGNQASLNLNQSRGWLKPQRKRG